MPTLEEAMLMAEGGSEENPYIVINNDLRTITPPTSTLLLGVYNDKEVLKVPFKMPRYYDDIDLSRFSIQINYINAMRIPNFDEADDIVVEDDHITFNWTTKRSVFLKDGTVQFSVCLRLSDIEGNVTKEFNTTIGYGIVLEGIEADADSEDPEAYSIIAHMVQIKNYVDGKSDAVAEVIDTAIDTITAKQSRVEELVEEASEAIDETRSMVSYPNVAETAAAMSDQTKIYVYTGSETGYNTGHWYYYKTGSGWTDGGLYMSQGVNTDTTLTFPDTPADSKATGIALSKKADYDGSYKELTSGDTYQIMSKKTLSDSGLMYPRKIETLFPNRTLGGKAFRDKLIGGSVVWNQLIQNGNFESTTDWVSSVDNYLKEISASDNILHVVVGPNAVGKASSYLKKNNFATLKTDHKYLATIDVKPSRKTQFRFLYSRIATNARIVEVDADTWLTASWVVSLKEDISACYFYFNVNNVIQEDDTIDFKNAMVIDLTQMFGSTIADYIYALEQNNEGAGVSYFRRYFPNDYYEYNPGEIISVTPGKFESVGFNIWDEEWVSGYYSSSTGAKASSESKWLRSKNKIKVKPSETYYMYSHGYEMEIFEYDKDEVYLVDNYHARVKNQTFIVGDNTHFITFNSRTPGDITTYNHDICINLSDPDKNGTYEPYIKHSYPLDSTLTLRGIPKLDESNNLYYDGDTYEPDGTVVRKYGIVDLGSLTWVYEGAAVEGAFRSSNVINEQKFLGNLVCAKFVGVKKATGSALAEGEVSITNSQSVPILRAVDSSYTDAAAFKEAMSGVMLVYELATPTVESLNPVSSPQSIALTGMEELTDREYEAGNRDVFLPAWHESRYTLDVVGELAFKNSYHDTLGAGVADQLMSKKKLTDTEPYTFRKTGGNLTGIGNRVYDEIVGGTVCWNQLIQNGDFSSTTDWQAVNSTIEASGNVLTVTMPVGSGPYGGFKRKDNTTKKALVNHKYLLTIDAKTNVSELRVYKPYVYDDTITPGSSLITMIGTEWKTIANVFNCTIDGDFGIGIRSRNPTSPEVETIIYAKNAQIFDLTQMFGSTIADYIYALEQQTEGAGVAYFRKYFTNDYYAYNPGELMSVSALQSHDSVGFNQWDEEWEVGGINHTTGENNTTNTVIRSKNYVPCLPATTYFFENANIGSPHMHYYDADKNFISYLIVGRNMAFTTPANAHYLRFNMPGDYSTTYNHDICINLSDPAKNGTYEPYVKHSYPLDSTLTLRGIPKVDESNNLYYDGDTYEPDGTVTRRYGIVDLGTLNWTYLDNENYPRFYSASLGNTALKPMPVTSNREIAKIFCTKYEANNVDNQYLGHGESSIGINTAGRIYVRDAAYTDATAFKAAMSGVYLLYELATPTIESAEPFQSPQVVDGGGTEEYVTNNPVKLPVGHNSSYGLDLEGKLETIVDTPSADGTYTLKVTVTNGVPVFSWS